MSHYERTSSGQITVIVLLIIVLAAVTILISQEKQLAVITQPGYYSGKVLKTHENCSRACIWTATVEWNHRVIDTTPISKTDFLRLKAGDSYQTQYSYSLIFGVWDNASMPNSQYNPWPTHYSFLRVVSWAILAIIVITLLTISLRRK